MEKFGEYDPATPLGKTFCPRISVQQYEEQGSQGTHTALQSLMDYMEEHPEIYKRVLAKRKKEDAENAGFMSFLKSKVLEAIQGESYMEDSITEDETLDKLTDMQKEMAEAYDYAQEAKSNNRRFSKRLASKRSGKALGCTSSKAAKTIPKKPSRKNLPPSPPYPPPISYDDSDGNSVKPTLAIIPQARPPIRSKSKSSNSKKGGAPVPPPPPPPPPPPGSFVQPKPLGERTNTIKSPGRQKTPKSKLASTPKPKPANLRKLSQYGSTTSLSSVGSVHDELMTFDKRKLKSVCNLRSLTGTPCHTPHLGKGLTATPVCGKAVGNFGTECVTAFNSLMVEKFHNARSPPSGVNSPSSGFNSPSGFTP